MRYPFVYTCLTRACNNFKESSIAIPDMPLYCSVCNKKRGDKATALTAQKIIVEERRRKKNAQGAFLYNRLKKINKQNEKQN
tara:strand:+ start:756 stop:1001 length:246 start_codon:yes stop_codon:yes gene_type:complete